MTRTPLSLREVGRWLPFWAAFAAALIFRVWSLGERPLSHDEAINASFLARLAEGVPWVYNPASFHGPFLYYAGVWPLRLLGTSEAALRFPLALASAGLIPLLLPVRRRLGRAGVTAAAWVLALSPSLVAVGRMLIHETWLGFFTLACACAASWWLETRRSGALLLACASAGLMLTVKETSLLTLATLLGAAGLARIVCAGSWRPAVPVVPRMRALLLPGAALVLPPLLLFSSFLSHPQGVLDALLGPLLWSKTGISGAGHAKSWDYFLELLAVLETVSLMGAGLGGWLAVRRRDPFGLFCAAWTAGQLALYSAIPYKTPWLAINLVIPAALTAGFAVREMMAWRGRRLILALGVLILVWNGGLAVWTAFIRYDDPVSFYSYAQSRREVRGLVAAVRDAVEKTPPPPVHVDVVVLHPWPLPWYFRGLPGIRWWKQVPPRPDGDVLVVDVRWEKLLRPRLRGSYVRRAWPFRPGETLAVYCRPRLCPAGSER